jgi:isopenicillin-N N-acyltransferase-like protein
MIHLNNVGTAYEIGRQHGASCPAAVRLAHDAWACFPGVEESRLDSGMEVVRQRLRRFFPENLEEMRGIAEGAGLTEPEILALNCFDAILGTATGLLSCSSIGFADSDAGVLLGKTADWNVDGAQDMASWQRYQPTAGEGHGFIHYGCAGTLWTEGGLNDCGLGMVLNGLPVTGPSDVGVPWVPLTRGVLQHCGTVTEAVEFLRRYDVMCWGFNLMLADANGDLAFVEVAPGAQGVQRPVGDTLIHTNHCLLAKTQALAMDEETITAYGYAGLAENSLARYATLERIVLPSPRTLLGMQALLRDRSVPGAISQDGEHGMRTAYAMIVAPAQGKIWGAEGFPPDVPFVEYHI